MLSSQRNFLPIPALAAYLLMGAPNASGADLGTSPSRAPSAADAQWIVSAAPYAWLPFLHGEQTVKGRSVDIAASPFEVLEHIEAVPWMSYIEARKGRLALYNDLFYAKLGVSGSASRSVLGLTLGAAADVDFEQTIIEVGAAYEVGRWRSGGGTKDPNVFERYTAIDILAGARYWHQDMAVNLRLTGALDLGGLVVTGSRAIARSGDVDWVDPLVGFRIRHQLALGQELLLRADVGGFDVGSQFSWNVLAAYSFDIAVRNGITYSGLLGYRALSVDFEKGTGLNRYEYDVVQHGPIMGLVVRF